VNWLVDLPSFKALTPFPVFDFVKGLPTLVSELMPPIEVGTAELGQGATAGHKKSISRRDYYYKEYKI
jgi:hypothetical protein